MSPSHIKYLLAINSLINEIEAVRVVDIAEYLGYSKASVCRCLDSLQFGGYCVRNADKTIELTDKSHAIIQEFELLHKHFAQILTEHCGIPSLRAKHEAYALLCAMSTESKNSYFKHIAKEKQQ